MPIVKFIQLAVRLDDLIRRKSTGTPAELARRLEVSDRMVYKYIQELKTLGAPIDYDHIAKSYVYTEAFRLEDIYNQLGEMDL